MIIVFSFEWFLVTLNDDADAFSAKPCLQNKFPISWHFKTSFRLRWRLKIRLVNNKWTGNFWRRRWPWIALRDWKPKRINIRVVFGICNWEEAWSSWSGQTIGKEGKDSERTREKND